MGTRDPRFDAYIAKAAPFARPILVHLRGVVHSACPDVVETMKWSHPSFEHQGLLCGMAAFKRHAIFGFWKHELLVKDDAKAREAMGSFGRITKLADLPPKALLARYVRKAMELNEAGVRAPRAKTRPKRAIPMHPSLKASLARSRRAKATFESFPPSHQREYLEWVAEAKAEDTRARRIATAIEWLEQGMTGIRCRGKFSGRRLPNSPDRAGVAVVRRRLLLEKAAVRSRASDPLSCAPWCVLKRADPERPPEAFSHAVSD